MHDDVSELLQPSLGAQHDVDTIGAYLSPSRIAFVAFFCGFIPGVILNAVNERRCGIGPRTGLWVLLGLVLLAGWGTSLFLIQAGNLERAREARLAEFDADNPEAAEFAAALNAGSVQDDGDRDADAGLDRRDRRRDSSPDRWATLLERAEVARISATDLTPEERNAGMLGHRIGWRALSVVVVIVTARPARRRIEIAEHRDIAGGSLWGPGIAAILIGVVILGTVRTAVLMGVSM